MGYKVELLVEERNIIFNKGSTLGHAFLKFTDDNEHSIFKGFYPEKISFGMVTQTQKE